MHGIIGSIMVFIGTYTGSGSKGIYVLRFAPDTGELRDTGLTAEIVNPSFLALHPAGTVLYAVTETGSTGERPSGAVSAFAIHPESGALSFLNQQLSLGKGPCHLSVNAAGTTVFVANYGSGTVSMLPLTPDGRLRSAPGAVQHEGSGPNQERQEGPHAHSITPDPATGLLYACDLGLDRIVRYRADAKGLHPVDPPLTTPPGSGPRHLDFHPDGKALYVVNELDSTVSVFVREDSSAPFQRVQTLSTLPAGAATDNTTGADIHVAPSGRFVYASNRGHDSIAVFGIDAGDYTLTALGYDAVQGRTPRNFALDPDGKWLLAANQDSNEITVFRLDPDTGRLHFTGRRIGIPRPVCIRFLPYPGMPAPGASR